MEKNNTKRWSERSYCTRTHTHTLRLQHIKRIVWHGRRVYYFNANPKCGNCASQHVAKKRSTYIHTSLNKYSTLCARTQASMYLMCHRRVCVHKQRFVYVRMHVCVCTCRVATVAAAAAAATAALLYMCVALYIYCRALCTLLFLYKDKTYAHVIERDHRRCLCARLTQKRSKHVSAAYKTQSK